MLRLCPAASRRGSARLDFDPRHALLAIGLCLLSPAVVGATGLSYSWGHPQPQGNTIFGMTFASADEGWAVGGSGFILHTTDGGEHWDLQHGPLAVAPDLSDIVWTPAGTLIASGAGEAIFRSTDLGASWNSPAHPSVGLLRDLCIVPGGDLSAAGDDGAVLRSTDDGLTWSQVGPGAGTIRHHVWVTSNQGYVVGQEVSHRTTNGGASWSEFIPAEFFGYNEVFFTDPQHGFVLEDFGWWTSVDGGLTWVEGFAPTPPLYRYRSLHLSADHWLLVCHGEGGELWETTNAGADWTEHYSQGGTGFPFIVQAPGGRVHFGSDLGDLFWTDDLGQTLHNAAINLGGQALHAAVEAFFARPDGRLFAANQPTSGETPAWLRSDDGGATWFVPPTTPGLYWAFEGGFYDSSRGVIGMYEQMRATTNGGDTWINSTLPATYRVTGFAFPAADRFFASAYRTSGGGGVFRSTDGGLSWSSVAGGLPTSTVAFTSIDFPTPSIGYATGGFDAASVRLYRTTDGGATWQQRTTSGLTSSIRSIVWFDANIGVASLGFESPGLRRTTDGGLHWTEVDDTGFLDLVPGNQLEAGAVGFCDCFRHTRDAGATWEAVSVPFSGPFPGYTQTVTALSHRDGGWLIGGSGCKILVATETTTAVSSPVDPFSARLSLIASPNPVGLATEIRLQTTEATSAQLSIYDAQGARVATLFEGLLTAGDHQLVWNAEDRSGRAVAQGVYFVRLATPRASKLLKLVVTR